MQRLLELFSGFEVGLAPGGDIDDFTGSRIAGCRFGFGVLDFQNAESPYLDPVALYERLPHRLEKAVYHMQGQIVGAADGRSNCPGQVLFGYGRHGAPLLGIVGWFSLAVRLRSPASAIRDEGTLSALKKRYFYSDSERQV